MACKNVRTVADVDSHAHCGITITKTLHVIANGVFPRHERKELNRKFWSAALQHTKLGQHKEEFAKAMGCEPPHLLCVLLNQKNTSVFIRPLRDLGFGTN